MMLTILTAPTVPAGQAAMRPYGQAAIKDLRR